VPDYGEGDDRGYDADGNVARDIIPPAAVDTAVADDDEKGESEAELEAAEGEEEVWLGEAGPGYHDCDES